MPNMTSAAKAIRQQILHSSRVSGHGHIPTSFSIIEMLMAVYETMRHRPKEPLWPGRDVFILSKGHAALGFYCVLSHYGYIDPRDTETFGRFLSNLGCHPDRHKVPGVEVSTGSLGHGLSVGAGMALAFRLQNSNRQVYTLIGDGESNEGTVWETTMIATHLNLSNYTILYDNNQSQKRSLPIANPGERFRAFGCAVFEVEGHDIQAIQQALREPVKQPKVLVCNTIKGHGCPTLVNNVYEWHRKSPNAEQCELLIGELNHA